MVVKLFDLIGRCGFDPIVFFDPEGLGLGVDLIGLAVLTWATTSLTLSASCSSSSSARRARHHLRRAGLGRVPISSVRGVVFCGLVEPIAQRAPGPRRARRRAHLASRRPVRFRARPSPRVTSSASSWRARPCSWARSLPSTSLTCSLSASVPGHVRGSRLGSLLLLVRLAPFSRAHLAGGCGRRDLG